VVATRYEEVVTDRLFGGGVQLNRAFSDKLIHTELRMKAALRDSSLIGVDEMGLRVAGHVGDVHVARIDGLTHYAYDEQRGKAAMDEIGILPQFTGTLVRDGFTSLTGGGAKGWVPYRIPGRRKSRDSGKRARRGGAECLSAWD
jgi:Transposase IS66 family